VLQAIWQTQWADIFEIHAEEVDFFTAYHFELVLLACFFELLLGSFFFVSLVLLVSL